MTSHGNLKPDEQEFINGVTLACKMCGAVGDVGRIPVCKCWTILDGRVYGEWVVTTNKEKIMNTGDTTGTFNAKSIIDGETP